MLEKHEATHTWIGTKRHYVTPGGEILPGVTTVLGKTKKDTRALDAWRLRVGEEEAERLSRQATSRGTAMHSAIEGYLLKEPYKCREVAVPYFQSIFPILQRVSDIHLVEGCVWHPNGYAGSVDCVARYNGELSVIDWKTADKPKRPNWIEDYFLQCAAYCAAVNRMYDLRIGRIVVAIAIPNQLAQVFTANGAILLDYWELFNDRLTQYKAMGYARTA
jgi:hypothetical protein